MIRFLEFHVSDVMSPDPLTVDRRTPLAIARALFEEHNYNTLPVVDDRELIAVVSQFDFLSAFVFTTESIIPHYDHILNQPLETIMQRDPEAVRPEQPLSRVLARMVETGTKSFPVLDGVSLVGIITRFDIFKGLHEDVHGQK